MSKAFVDEHFDYEIDEKRVYVYFDEEHIKTLKGKEAQSFIRKIDACDDREAQALMAKVTGYLKKAAPKRSRMQLEEEF